MSINESNMTVFVPEDIVLEILVHLQAKPLCKFRRVSKSWRAIITDPFFSESRNRHLRRQSTTKPIILVIRSDHEIYRSDGHLHFYALETDGNLTRYRFDRRSRWSPRKLAVTPMATFMNLVYFHGNHDSFILDPTINKTITLPTSDLYDDRGQVWAGFGYVPATNEYKILQSTISDIGRPVDWEIITVGSSTSSKRWRAAPKLHGHQCRVYSSGVCAEGLLHFLSAQSLSNVRVDCIARFDLEGESWSRMWLPTQGPHARLHRDRYWWELREVRGLLCAVVHVRGGPNGRHDKELWVYLLRDYVNGLWVHECTVELPQWCRSRRWTVSPLMVDEDGRVLIMSKHGLHFYNPEGKWFQKVEAKFAGSWHEIIETKDFSAKIETEGMFNFFFFLT